MAMRERCDTALAARRTAIKPRHLGRGSRLVDEHQPLDVDLRLRCLPRRAFSGHVRPILLAGVRCFFERDVAAIEEPPNHARHEALAVRFEEMVGDLGQRHIRCGPDQGEDLRRMALDPGRAPVPTLHTRLTGACAPPLAHQLDRRRRRHTEPAGSASTAHALIFHGPNDAKTKIRRKGFGHAGWPPSPALNMNHNLPRQGNPLPIPPGRKTL